MLTTAGQGNRAAESYAEGKRRVPILSTASDMQTAANLNSRAEDTRRAQVPSPVSAVQTATAGGYSVEAASGDRYAGEQDEGG